MLKIALSDTAISSRAVLNSILALSCLHLQRDAEALAYKHSAISLVAKSLKAGVGPKVAFESIAANMLLSLYEV